MRCSHCGQSLCLTHFLNRTCFHTPDNDDEAYDMDVDLAYPSDEEFGQEDIDDEELTLLSREFLLRQQANPTSSTPGPLGDEILGGCGCRR